MAVKKDSNSEPAIRRPYDDEVVDPFSGDDVELRDPWDDGGTETVEEKPVEPVKKSRKKDE